MRYFSYTFRKESLQLLSKVKEILNHLQDLVPLGVRQIFYQVISLPQSPLSNSKRDCDRLGRLLVNARWSGEIQFDVIEDKTRHTSNEPMPLEQLVEYYYPEAWTDQPNYVEVMVEKEGLRRFFAKVLRPYYVKVTPTSGFDSLSNVMEIAKRLNAYCDRPRYVFTFSDFDPSGEWISKDFSFRLKKSLIMLGEDPDFFDDEKKEAEIPNLEITKVALNLQQIEKYKLPPKFVKPKDPRASSFMEKYGENIVVELDAMPPKALQEVILESIYPYLDSDEITKARELEQTVKENVLEALRELTDPDAGSADDSSDDS